MARKHKSDTKHTYKEAHSKTKKHVFNTQKHITTHNNTITYSAAQLAIAVALRFAVLVADGTTRMHPRRVRLACSFSMFNAFNSVLCYENG
jgi:hypothetical protein